MTCQVTQRLLSPPHGFTLFDNLATQSSSSISQEAEFFFLFKVYETGPACANQLDTISFQHIFAANYFLFAISLSLFVVYVAMCL